MSTRIFFLNSNTTLYGEEELNAIAKLFINQGVLNTLQDNNDDWVSNGDLKVLENSDGADMTVEVNTGWAIIETIRNTKTFKTFAQVINSLKLPISANDTGNDRVDTVIARVSRTVESNILANNVFTIEVITGTSGTALTDEEILAEIDGDDFLRLADITVGDGVTEIETADITDTRVMAETNQGLKHSPKVIFMGALANDPVNLDEGMLWYNETTHTLNFFNGNNTIQLGGAAGGYNPLKPSAQAEPDMTVAVASGNVRFGDTNLNFAGGNSPSFTAPTTPGDNRIDLLCLDYNGTLSIVQGIDTSGTPVVPDYPVGKFVVCEVFLRNGATSIKDTDDTVNGYIYNDARGFYSQDLDAFFDGSDGNVTISTNTTLTRDMYYNNLTINNGITLTTGNYKVFVKNTLSGTGKISATGLGVAGLSTNGNGNGEAGGICGGAAGNGSGFPGTTTAPTPLTMEGMKASISKSVTLLSSGYNLDTKGDLKFGKGGGGGGRSDHYGVRGGSGGGIIFMAARHIGGTLIFESKGTNGSYNASFQSTGGGGGGGCVILIYKTKTSYTIDVSGGLGGASADPGVNGLPGTSYEIQI